MSLTNLAIFGLPGGSEWIVIGLIALLLFGRKLPEVARSLGKSIVEFKKGIRDVQSDIDDTTKLESKPLPKIQQKSEVPEGTAAQSKSSSVSSQPE